MKFCQANNFDTLTMENLKIISEKSKGNIEDNWDVTLLAQVNLYQL